MYCSIFHIMHIHLTKTQTDAADGTASLTLEQATLQAQQECAAPLKVAQIDIIAQRRPHDLAAAVDGQYDLWLGIVPF